MTDTEKRRKYEPTQTDREWYTALQRTVDVAHGMERAAAALDAFALPTTEPTDSMNAARATVIRDTLRDAAGNATGVLRAIASILGSMPS